MLTHEESARKVHKQANHFLAASRLGRVVGWTFHVPRDPSEEYGTECFSWVTLEGDATSDTYGTRHEAQSVLKSYLKVKRQAPRGKGA